MNQLSSEQLGKLKSELQEQKRELERQLLNNDHFGLSDALGEQSSELSTYDNHPGDVATELYERSKDIALNANAEERLEEIEAALLHMGQGEYGLCAVCHEQIPFDRLEALPTTRYCLQHAEQMEASANYRPVEEEFLSPPFGRTSLDEHSKETEFDGEDAWQIVESWGSSNSPAMFENPNIVDSYNDMYVESDEHEGYVESLESFLATDIYGHQVYVLRNKAYQEYMHSGEGEPLLEDEQPEDS
jgi:YteA family regulatory protein